MKTKRELEIENASLKWENDMLKKFYSPEMMALRDRNERNIAYFKAGAYNLIEATLTKSRRTQK